ncbi:MAG TPA: hypothetical protein VFT43_02430, partial [Candidatus Polarisedimenticolia bacterium]|nr:hypothetical protein [Candidatus Polarisedimenticolia bacterium]
MPGLLGPLISFVKNHPVIGGTLVIALGILLIDLSLDGAKRYRLYEGAGEIKAQVLSITKASSVPPRFDLILSWP